MYAVVASCVCSLESIKKVKESIQPDTWMDSYRLCSRVEVFGNLLAELKNFPHLLENTDKQEQQLLTELEKVLIAVEAYATDFVNRTTFKGITESSFRHGCSNDFGKLNQQIMKFAHELGINNCSEIFDHLRQEDLEDQRKSFQYAYSRVLEELSTGNDLYMDQSFEQLRQDVEQYPQHISKFLAANKHMGLTIQETKLLKTESALMKKSLDYKIAERLKALFATQVHSPANTSGEANSNLSSTENSPNTSKRNFESSQPLLIQAELITKIVNGDSLNYDEKTTKKKLLSELHLSDQDISVSRIRIGQGGFGDVFLGTFRRKYKVAIKSLRCNLDDPHADSRKKTIENELLLMKFLGSYPTILSCYGYTVKEEDESLQIVLELAPFGSLDQMLRDKNNYKHFPLQLSLSWLCDLADAIKFLHSKGIKHRDIKAENMLVFDKFYIKLCDFGPAKQQLANVTAESKVGTFCFMAPEIRVGKVSEMASDIFSFAMTALQIFRRKTPQLDDFTGQIVETLKAHPFPNPMAHEKIYQLLIECVQSEPFLRPTAEKVCQTFMQVLDSMGGDPRENTDDYDEINQLLAVAKKREADRLKSSLSKSGSNMFRPQSINLSRKNSPALSAMGFSSNEHILKQESLEEGEEDNITQLTQAALDGNNFMGGNRNSFYRAPSAISLLPGQSSDIDDKNTFAKYFNLQLTIPLVDSLLIGDLLVKNGVANLEILRRRLIRNDEFLLDLGIDEKINDIIVDEMLGNNNKANLSATSSVGRSTRSSVSSSTASSGGAASPRSRQQTVAVPSTIATEVSRLYYDAAQLNKPEALVKLQELSVAGDKLAEGFLMRMYALGQGPIKKDTKKAQGLGTRLLPWLKDSLESNDLSVMYVRYLIGVCYFEGLGTIQDQREGARWCKLSAEAGYSAAQAYLGFCFFSGLGVPRNLEESVRWYRMAGDQGYAPAQCNLGIAYEHGYGVAENPEAAIKWYRLAADQGDAAALYNLGYCYEKGIGVNEDLREAARYYKCSAGSGYTAAQYNLGICYYFGNGVERNLEEAVTWYRIAADKGYAAAQCNLGLCYENGHGIEKDHTEAVYWYRQAADQGHPAALYYLGFCYFSAMGLEKDYDQAVHYYKLSAEKKYPPALNNLGFCYFNGVGVPKNFSLAIKYYRASAELGYAPAQYNMGYCYEKGYGVVTKLHLVIHWYRLAAENGNEKAKKALTRFQVY